MDCALSKILVNVFGANPNIKIQRAGAKMSDESIGDFPAADLGVRRSLYNCQSLGAANDIP
jgi:hypothetical protein